MDPEANQKEQLEVANEIMKICDECPESGEFTEFQEHQLMDRANRLAELVISLNEWKRLGN